MSESPQNTPIITLVNEFSLTKHLDRIADWFPDFDKEISYFRDLIQGTAPELSWRRREHLTDFLQLLTRIQELDDLSPTEQKIFQDHHNFLQILLENQEV